MSLTWPHQIPKALPAEVQPVKLFNSDGTWTIERGVTES